MIQEQMLKWGKMVGRIESPWKIRFSHHSAGVAAQAQRTVVEGVRGPLVAAGVRALLRPLGGDVAPARRHGLRRSRGPGGLVGS